MYDTLDSLLLNNSPKSMEMISHMLSSKLEQLVAQDASDVEDDETAALDTIGSEVATKAGPEGVETEGDEEKTEPTAQG